MSDTQQIKDNIDIVDFISEYLTLKPAGSNYKGLCPFHNEKSPSFMVNRDRQNWHCFGCQKGGDIFSFLQEMDGLDFVEALQILAEKAGVTLDRTNFTANKQAGEQKVQLKEIMKEAVRFYHQFLKKMELAAPAREYLRERGLSDHTIDVWHIGYVPDQWDLLTKYLLKKGYSIDDIVAAGLTIKRDGANKTSGKGYYDRFRGRVMFPICDAHGAPVGVTGRVLVETDKSGGKYVNTPQTAIYDKSRVLFGLDKAKGAIRAADEVVVVEGQMDVISVWQSGMEQVVASSGTALTEEQIKLMKRYTKNMVMAFDTDKAGLAAAKRGIAIALEAGMRVRVIQISPEVAKDPDECVKKAPDVWAQAVTGAKEVLQWYIDLAEMLYDFSSPHGKQDAAAMVLPEIARIPHAVEREHWLEIFAVRLGVDRSVLKEDMILYKLNNSYKASSINNTSENTPISSEIIQKETKIHVLMKEWMALLLSTPTLQMSVFPEIRLSTFLTPELIALYESIKMVYTPGNTLDLAQVELQLSDMGVLNTLLMQGELHFSSFSLAEKQAEFEQLTNRLQQEIDTAYRSTLIAELAQAEAAGDTDLVTALLSQLS